MQDKLKKEITNNIQTSIDIISSFYTSYKSKYSWKLRLIDSFIIFNLLLAFLQIFYMILVGNFPKNSFLSGVICNIGTISITSSFRMSLLNSDKSSQRLFLEYVLCSFSFYLVIVNFLG